MSGGRFILSMFGRFTHHHDSTGRLLRVTGLAAILFVLWSAPANAQEDRSSFGKGLALGLHHRDDSRTYARELREIAELGADSVCLLVSAHQADVTATRIALQNRAPSEERIVATIRRARDHGLEVLYMPIVLLETTRSDTEWRGSIEPADVDEWFDSYRAFIVRQAELAQEGGATSFSVGSELCSMEKYADRWRALIAAVRDAFDGPLLYSANWDHYRHIVWLDDLDLLGINAYHKMSEGGGRPSVEDMKARWAPILAEMKAWHERWGKPIVVTEVGYASQSGATDHPWDYTASETVDLQIQADAYRALFGSWNGKAWVSAIFIYDWWGEGGTNHTGYTARDKPAEAVLRAWFARD